MYYFPTLRQEQDTFFQCIREKKLVLFGTGHNAANFILDNPTVKIEYICDNDYRKTGKKLFGIPIFPFARLQQDNLEQIAILITPPNCKSITSQILEHTKACNLFFYEAIFQKHREDFADYFYEHHDALLETADLLHDAQSKHVLKSISEKYQCGTYDFGDIYTPEQYYLPEMYEKYQDEDKIVIDAGAWQGDTITGFIRHFGDKLKKAYLFEPAPENRKVLLDTVLSNLSYDLRVFPYALSDEEGTADFVYMDTLSGASYLKDAASAFYHDRDKTEHIVKVRRIDDIIPSDEKVSFLKMDIEGAEMAALRGAKNIITTHKPCLAIAIYHSGFDYIHIPRYVKQLVPEYKLYVRHHARNRAETVLYAFV